MHRRRFLMSSAAAAALMAAPAIGKKTATPVPMPLLDAWKGPHGGAPAFDRVKVGDFKPAIMRGIAMNRGEIAKIASNRAKPTFQNTIAALEDAGRPLARAGSVFNVYITTMDDKAMQTVEKEMAPVLAAFQDEIIQNARLFARVKAVYDTRETSGLTPEQQRLTWVVYRRFARQGAALPKAGKSRLAAINKRLAALYTTFSQNELADEENHWLVLDEAGLGGLPESLRTAAAAAAEAKNLKGK